MNKKITFCLLGFMASFLCSKINAQNYQTLNVTSGYNEDLIANGAGAASSSTTQSVDDPANGFVFMSKDFVNASGASPASGLPDNGLINSENTSGLSFQLGSYSSNNSLRLLNANDSGTLSFNSTPKASKLYILATTGSGNSVADILVTFTDGTSQTFVDNSVSDWYWGSFFTIKGIGRVSRISDNIENDTYNPRLYEITLPISAANQTKNIANVKVTKTSSGSEILNVFGFSYLAANSCITPDNITSSNVTSNSATISWSPVPASSSYEIYRSTNNTPPIHSTVPTITGVTGSSINIPGLSPNTLYYVWVRNNCGGGSTSDWSSLVSFTTACDAVDVPYLENFNAVNNYSIPACTSMQSTGFFGGWSVSDLTGVVPGFDSNGIFCSMYSMADSDAWFYTQGINLQAGTSYTLSFIYANYQSPQSLKVAYGESPVDTSMVNIIADYPDVNVTSATTATFTVTPISTGVYYFGFQNYTPAANVNMSGTIMLDDISVTQSNLSTQDSEFQNNNVDVYPNPTSDYLQIRSKKKITEAKIFDVSGKLVLSSDKIDQKIDVSQLIKGVYILSFKSIDGTFSRHKFIKN